VRLLKNLLGAVLNAGKKGVLHYSLAVWRPLLVKTVFSSVGVFIAPSRFLMETYVRAGLPQHKVRLCRHGIDTAPFLSLHKHPADRMRFAFLGSVRPHKGVDLLIDAFNRIPAPHTLHIYGPITPAMRAELSGSITNPRIHLAGDLPDGQKAETFSAIDVLVLPSRCHENSPLVIAEAFAARIPVIVSAMGGMTELVQDGTTGLVFPCGDSTALERCLLRFVAEPDLKDRMAAAIQPQKTMAEHAEELIGLYSSPGAS